MRVFARVEYDGAPYAGWQIQPDIVTVQSEIERALFSITQVKTSIVASGRTDAGVHGKAQGIHFDIVDSWELYKLSQALNSQLPPSIFIYNFQKVAQSFHARFDARKRTYIYSLTPRKSPLRRERTVMVRYPTDWKLFEMSLNQILGKHNFRSFCAAHGYSENYVCTVTEALLTKVDDNLYTITISADRFIYKMIRNIVGTCLDIARGKIKRTMAEIILAEDRGLAGATAPPQGLVLESVLYDEVI